MMTFPLRVRRSMTLFDVAYAPEREPVTVRPGEYALRCEPNNPFTKTGKPPLWVIDLESGRVVGAILAFWNQREKAGDFSYNRKSPRTEAAS